MARAEIQQSLYGNKQYKLIERRWKAPLARKRLRRARLLENPPTVAEADTSGEECIYVHNPEEGVTLPPHPSKIYAVIDVKGHQHKVTKDDRVILEKLIPTDPDAPVPEVGQ